MYDEFNEETIDNNLKSAKKSKAVKMVNAEASIPIERVTLNYWN